MYILTLVNEPMAMAMDVSIEAKINYYYTMARGCTIIVSRLPSKRPLPDKRLCTEFQGAAVAASIQTYYGILIPGKHLCEPKLQVMFKRSIYILYFTTIVRFLMHPSAGSSEYESTMSGRRMHIYRFGGSHCDYRCRVKLFPEQSKQWFLLQVCNFVQVCT